MRRLNFQYLSGRLIVKVVLYDTCLVQVRTKTDKKVLTWQSHLSLTALCGTCPVQVRTKTGEKFLTWHERDFSTSQGSSAIHISGR